MVKYCSANTDLPATSKPFADLGIMNIRPHGWDLTPLDLRPNEKRVHRPGHVARARRRRSAMSILWRPSGTSDAASVTAASTATGRIRVWSRRARSYHQRSELSCWHRCWHRPTSPWAHPVVCQSPKINNIDIYSPPTSMLKRGSALNSDNFTNNLQYLDPE